MSGNRRQQEVREISEQVNAWDSAGFLRLEGPGYVFYYEAWLDAEIQDEEDGQ